eukprot:jgi/Psemu1/38214/gm1.38214_g
MGQRNQKKSEVIESRASRHHFAKGKTFGFPSLVNNIFNRECDIIEPRNGGEVRINNILLPEEPHDLPGTTGMRTQNSDESGGKNVFHA